MIDRSQSHTTLYRLYDANGELLYVGIAGNPGRRFEQHAEDKPWWSEVAATTLEHYDTRPAALAAEAAAIVAERPRHNIVHNRGRRVASPPAGVDMTKGRTDRLTLADERPFDDSLIGSFFHSFEGEGADKRVLWQGCVVGEPAPSWYLVETFSWLMGESFTQQLVRIDDMAAWDFYDNAEWMNSVYKTRWARRSMDPEEYRNFLDDAEYD